MGQREAEAAGVEDDAGVELGGHGGIDFVAEADDEVVDQLTGRAELADHVELAEVFVAAVVVDIEDAGVSGQAVLYRADAIERRAVGDDDAAVAREVEVGMMVYLVPAGEEIALVGQRVGQADIRAFARSAQQAHKGQAGRKAIGVAVDMGG